MIRLLAANLLAVLLGLLGVRLLVLAARSRKLPELWIGLFFVFTTPGAWLLLRVVGAVRAGVTPAYATVGAGMALVALGTIAAWLFTYQVFRPGSRVALGVVVVASLLCVWGAFQQVGGLSGHVDFSRVRVEFVAPRAFGFGWATWEALRMYRMMQRRAALGLGDPVVRNRFLLFASWSASMCVLPLLQTVDRLVGTPGRYPLWAAVLARPIGATMLIAIFLNFFPPRAYLRWLRRKRPPSEAPP